MSTQPLTQRPESDRHKTKGKLIEEVARQLEGQRNYVRAELIVNTIFKTMSEALKENNRVEIRGFGTFEVRAYRPYVGRNPKTGESVDVHSKRSPFFKAGKLIREELNG